MKKLSKEMLYIILALLYTASVLMNMYSHHISYSKLCESYQEHLEADTQFLEWVQEHTELKDNYSK